jgi:16S rRNA (guanine527-N7)-methyltransferase
MSPSGGSWSPRYGPTSEPSVKRETLEATLARHDVDPALAPSLEALLAALAAEPDPPTTVRDPRDAVPAHVADSLAGMAVPELRSATRLADLGSGAGFPGLVLALALPDARVDLVESARRKCAVIERLRVACRADSARVVPLRVEEWAAAEGHEAYEAATARALASLPVLCEYAAPLLRVGGVLVAWRGARVDEEETAGDRAAASLGLSAGRVLRVEPFEGAHSRHLHVFLKREATPPGFPRRPGMAVKRPLGGTAR